MELDYLDHHTHPQQQQQQNSAAAAGAFDSLDVGRPAFGYEPFNQAPGEDPRRELGAAGDDESLEDDDDDIEVIETICDNCSRTRTLEHGQGSNASAAPNAGAGSSNPSGGYIQAIQSRLTFFRFFRVFVSRSGRKKVMLKEDNTENEDIMAAVDDSGRPGQGSGLFLGGGNRSNGGLIPL